MNSRRYAMTSLSIVLLAVTIMSVSALGQNAYAGGAGMSLSAEGSGATIDVSGTSDRSDLDVTIVLIKAAMEYMMLLKHLFQVAVTLHHLT